jgi:threonine dehydratase
MPLVRASVPPTPQYAWPLLKALTGVQIVVKHENHTPIGAFKVRGGLVYFDRLKRERPAISGIVTATRGNHGQSLAYVGARARVAVTIVVPHGNSTEKNAAMRSFGAELMEHGRDFDEAKERAMRIASERGLEYAPLFHRDFVIGVATYAHELFSAVDDLGTVYVPIGLGSGICGLIGTRDALGLKAKIVGVVAEAANAYFRSFTAGPGGGDQLCTHFRRWHSSARARSDGPRLFARARIESSRCRTTKSLKRSETSNK